MNQKHDKAYDPNFFEYVGSSVIFSVVHEIIQYETVTIDRNSQKACYEGCTHNRVI